MPHPQRAVLASEVCAIVFFDGSCGLCQSTVRLLHALDQADCLRFAPLCGQTANDYGLSSFAGREGSLVVFEPISRSQFVRSEAVIACLRALGWPWTLLAWALRLVPRPVRDGLYCLVARQRRRLPLQVCEMPEFGLRDKLLP